MATKKKKTESLFATLKANWKSYALVAAASAAGAYAGPAGSAAVAKYLPEVWEGVAKALGLS